MNKYIPRRFRLFSSKLGAVCAAQKNCHGDRSEAEWSHPLFFSNRNTRWLDFARHDSMMYWNTPIGESI
jgi:hypothetical protein